MLGAIVVLLIFPGIPLLFVLADQHAHTIEVTDPLSNYNLDRLAKQKCLDSGGVPNTNFWTSEKTCKHY